MNRLLALGAAGLVAVVLLLSTLFTVHQTQQVLITQFGQPVRVIREPGLHAKLPFVQSVIAFDRRLLDFEAPGEEVILGDQRRLIMDTFTRYRITDPLTFFQTVGSSELGIRGRLSSIVSSALRRVLGGEPLLSVLSADRARIMAEIRRQVNEEARRFGIEVADVRIRRADLPEENTQAILQRMQSERQRVAAEARAEGNEVGARIRAGAERERTVILAEANAQADILRGQGEQEAIAIFADAFQRDPGFFQFYRTMQAYQTAFSEGESRLLLTPDSDFFRFFREAPQVANMGGSSGPAAAASSAARTAAAPAAPAVAPAAAAPVPQAAAAPSAPAAAPVAAGTPNGPGIVAAAPAASAPAAQPYPAGSNPVWSSPLFAPSPTAAAPAPAPPASAATGVAQ